MFYLACFNLNQTYKFHCERVIEYLFIILQHRTHDFEEYDDVGFKELCKDYNLEDFNQLINKYRINIDMLADHVADPKYDLCGLPVSYCSSASRLQKVVMKNVKQAAKNFDKSSKEYKEFKNWYGRLKITNDPKSIVESLNVMSAKYDAEQTVNKIFNTFEDYITYIFTHK